MNRRARLAVGAIAALAVTFAGWLVWPDLTEADPEAVPFNSTPELVAYGEYLARAGNCIGCHTAPGGAPFAGGLGVATPFGAVYSTNLTPDIETGIGAWSSADFWRAMHYGKSREGRALYPAFPYPSYTRVSRADTDAIFAYLGSLPPVESGRIRPSLRFPYNTPLALAFWRALYFRPGEHSDDPERSAQWNRGAYLVEGLGHCGACHSGRTLLGGADSQADYAGGELAALGWDALPLTFDRQMSDEEAQDMAQLLMTGVSRCGVVSGPMAEVVLQSTQHLTAEDIDAIVAYIRALPPRAASTGGAGPPVSNARRHDLARAGAAVYAEHCADCHGDNGEGEPYVYPALAGNRLVTAASPNNLLLSVLLGGFAPSTAGNPRPHSMPSFAHRLSAEEVAAVATYLRSAWGNDAPAVTPAAVQRR